MDLVDNNTIIILASDHGWSLGQHSEWAKQSNYEEVTRVPLIFVPDSNSALLYMVNRDVNNFVELVDLFPSLVSLADLPTLSTCPKESRQGE